MLQYCQGFWDLDQHKFFSQRPVCLGVDVNTQSCHLGCGAHQKYCSAKSISGDLQQDVLSDSNMLFRATRAQTLSTRHKERDQ